MDTKLYVAIPTKNRRTIAEKCIPTVLAGLKDEDFVCIYDDGSSEPPPTFDRVNATFISEQSKGIELQRRAHFYDFWDRLIAGGKFTHLYLTDNDAIHDPSWRAELLRLQEKYGQRPICGYNTAAHVRLDGNTVKDNPEDEVIWRRVAPGVSYLLTVAHVDTVVRKIKYLPDPLHWDWTIPAILGHLFAVTRMSLVDHIGVGGMHHPASEGLNGGDRALNPTPWLVEKRQEIVSQLEREV